MAAGETKATVTPELDHLRLSRPRLVALLGARHRGHGGRGPQPGARRSSPSPPTRCRRTSRSSATSSSTSGRRPTRPTPTSSCASPTSSRTPSRCRACPRADACSPGLAEGLPRLHQGRQPRACPTGRTTSTMRPKPIEPGKVYEFEIEIWATSCCFPKGHRICASTWPATTPTPSTSAATTTASRSAADTVYHDKDHPSHLVLPVIPA